MTLKQEIIDELREKLELSDTTRKAILDQLALKDASIDKIDILINNIDEKIPPLLKNINDRVNDVKDAFDARVSAGCTSELIWELTVTDGNKATMGADINTYTCIKNPDVLVDQPYYGQKYYRKPLNRDFGSSIIAEVIGISSANSTTLTVVGAGVTDAQDTVSGVSIGDIVTDNLDSPQIFNTDNLPRVVGIGSTFFVGVTTTVSGRISGGSSEFAVIGGGTTEAVLVGSAVSFTGVLPLGTTVVGIGTTVVEFQAGDQIIYDDIAGDFITTSVVLGSLILSEESTFAGIVTGVMAVGDNILTPSLLLSEAANANFSGLFTIIRNTSDIDADFDFEKSPLEPVTIGVIGNQFGLGHETELTFNGHPPGPFQWNEQSQEPEPDTGAGKVTYSTGTGEWPVITTGGRGVGSVVTYAEEGTVIVSTSSTLSGGADQNPTVTTTPPPLIYQGASACADLKDAADAAQAALTAAINENAPKLLEFIALSAALRQIRDDEELIAYSMLQGAAFQRSESNKLRDRINRLQVDDLQEYEP